MEADISVSVPELGMEFATVDEAWDFWNNYGGNNGFGVRKGVGHKSTKGDDLYTSYVFLCQCEGTRREDKRDHATKKPRAEIRTDCQVRMQIKLDRASNKMKVVKFVSEHNHPLQRPEACYLLRSQRSVPEVACIDIQLADSSGIRPREAHELLSRQAGGLRNIGYTINDHKNCLRNMRKQSMEYGAAVAITKYFERRALENSFFQHFEDITEEQEIANIFWADAKMIAAYVRFGDVVIFDTTFGTNREKWAFGAFVGFNHFREIVIFGAALMCNQTTESFEWVFQKFLEAHGGKRPITLFTDQDIAMGVALEHVMPSTRHGLCAWHISQNCQKYLMRFNKDGINVTGEFLACMFHYEEEAEFEFAFKELRTKLEDNCWLKFIYESKEKWAYCFMKDAYTLGIRSTQASESINSSLKSFLNCKLDVNRFLEQFERVIAIKREKEITSDYDMKLKRAKIKFKIPILCEAGELYTPKIFELFQSEFELSGSAYIECLEGNTYTVGMCDRKSRQVVWNRDDETILCSCKKFEREGILCSHALKVLDREDVKKIPPLYILKRWTQVANDETVVDGAGRIIVEDAMLEIRNRNAHLVRVLASTCNMAANNQEQTQFLLNGLCSLQEQFQQKFGNKDGNLLRLKKKDGDKRSKRRQPWNEKLSRRKKGKHQSTSSSQALPSVSQEEPEGTFGCYDNLEDLYNLEIAQ